MHPNAGCATARVPATRRRTAMHPIRIAAFAILLAAPGARAADRPGMPRIPPFHLVNASFDSVTGFAVAAAGTGDYRAVALGRALQGGLDAVTFDLPAGGCLRDLRATFANGRVLDVPAIDVCRRHGLRLAGR
jgi:hypothetical protein